MKSEIRNQKSGNRRQRIEFKRQNSEGRKIIFQIFSVFCFLFSVFSPLFSICFAKEITILYTGSTHAMLYTCSCPKETDGGVARRAALIKELRKQNPNTLVLDSGAFFAGGLLDEYTQNTQLDIQRTQVNLKALEIMHYDALNISPDEFNFGREFLEKTVSGVKLPFISSNIQTDKFLPYIIRDMQGVKVGIIGISDLSVRQKAAGINVLEYRPAIESAVGELKKKAIDVVILLSNINESVDTGSLYQGIKGLDVVITAYNRGAKWPVNKAGSTLIFGSSWQGRRLGKLSLFVKDNKINDYKAEELRLSDNISDDKTILSILPKCFSDMDCKQNGIRGHCENSGISNAKCVFPEISKIGLRIIVPKQSKLCNTQPLIDHLKQSFPGIDASYIYYPGSEAQKLIKELDIKALPVFLLDKAIEKERNFNDEFKKNLTAKDNFYMIKHEYSGVCFFPGREEKKGNLDLFLSLYEKDSKGLLDIVKEYNPSVHFLAIEQDKKFDAAKGNLEVEDYLRAVCVKKYYPEKFWSYISCRSADTNTSWWQSCLESYDENPIRACATGEEGANLLRENIGLNKELQVMFGPVYLLNNREVFSFQGLSKKEDLEKILRTK